LRAGEQDFEGWTLDELPLVVNATILDREGRPIDDAELHVEAGDPQWLRSGPLKVLRPRPGVIAAHGRTAVANLDVRAAHWAYDELPPRRAAPGEAVQFELTRRTQAAK
jgi:hypothetical protein